MNSEPRIRNPRATAYTIPTDAPEGDGTFQWDQTTLVLVEMEAGDAHGLGYTYSHAVTAPLARDLMKHAVEGADPFAIPAIFEKIRELQRNYGSGGIAATALSAIDMALWDLKAKLLGRPLVGLLGQVRESAPVYGSGGFTTYSDAQLRGQLGGWVEQGIPRVKMKIGAHPEQDCARVKAAREAIGGAAELFVDANGAYARKQALAFAERFQAEYGVTWFEEPVSSDDLAGLRLLRGLQPGGDGDRRGRVRVARLRSAGAAGRGRGRRAAGGCDAMWRRDGLFRGFGAGRGASDSAFGALRTFGTPAPGVRRGAAAACGVLPRSCTDRGDAF